MMVPTRPKTLCRTDVAASCQLGLVVAVAVAVAAVVAVVVAAEVVHVSLVVPTCAEKQAWWVYSE